MGPAPGRHRGGRRGGERGRSRAACSSVVRSWVLAAPRRRRGGTGVRSRRRPVRPKGQSSPTGHAYTRMYSPAWLALSEGRFADAHDRCTTLPPAIVGGHRGSRAGQRRRGRAGRRQGRAREIARMVADTRLLGAPFRCARGHVRGVRAWEWTVGSPEAGLAFSTAAELVRRLGYVARAGPADVARATLIRPPDPRPRPPIAEAREILTGLGAVSLLKLLDDAVAGAGSEEAVGSVHEQLSTRAGTGAARSLLTNWRNSGRYGRSRSHSAGRNRGELGSVEHERPAPRRR